MQIKHAFDGELDRFFVHACLTTTRRAHHAPLRRRAEIPMYNPSLSLSRRRVMTNPFSLAKSTQEILAILVRQVFEIPGVPALYDILDDLPVTVRCFAETPVRQV